MECGRLGCSSKVKACLKASGVEGVGCAEDLGLPGGSELREGESVD